MSDPSYNTKIYLKQGGEELVVAPGGIISADGTQATALSTSALPALTTAGLAALSTSEISSLAPTVIGLQTDLNAIKTALTNIGVLASS